ncbi:MAG: OmpA family protein [Enhydrobacter sp.]|nr:MAG: OmpA family protein [Enhydrobacter sp.]
MASLYRIALAALVLGGATTPCFAQRADVEGSSDHALVGRHEGSKITFYESRPAATVALPWKAQERNDREDEAWQHELVGKVLSIRYDGPPGRSILDVLRGYEASLQRHGFQIQFVCRDGAECAPGRSASSFWDAARAGIDMPTTWHTTVYLLASRASAAGVTTVAVMGVETEGGNTKLTVPHVAVTIVEGKPAAAAHVRTIDARALEQALARDGRVVLQAIEFAPGTATLAPAAAAQIEQLADMLRKQPQIELLIVGHTDDAGTVEQGVALSRKQADAVVAALAVLGIDTRRLAAAGAGPMVPIASNRIEHGRVRNRRIEIVERIGPR